MISRFVFCALLAILPGVLNSCLKQPLDKLPEDCLTNNLTIESTAVSGEKIPCNASVPHTLLTTQPNVYLNRVPITSPHKQHTLVLAIFERLPNLLATARMTVNRSRAASFDLNEWISSQIKSGVQLCGPLATARITVSTESQFPGNATSESPKAVKRPSRSTLQPRAYAESGSVFYRLAWRSKSLSFHAQDNSRTKPEFAETKTVAKSSTTALTSENTKGKREVERTTAVVSSITTSPGKNTRRKREVEKTTVADSSNAPTSENPASKPDAEKTTVADSSNAPKSESPTGKPDAEKTTVADSSNAPKSENPASKPDTEKTTVADSSNAPKSENPASKPDAEKTTVADSSNAPKSENPARKREVEKTTVADSSNAPKSENPAGKPDAEKTTVADSSNAPKSENPAGKPDAEKTTVADSSNAPKSENPASKPDTEKTTVADSSNAPKSKNPASKPDAEKTTVADSSNAPTSENPASKPEAKKTTTSEEGDESETTNPPKITTSAHSSSKKPSNFGVHCQSNVTIITILATLLTLGINYAY
ncbi:hypothetical protein V9T40_006559 [Parthenolecanium corni]|uniref:Uncharacterized protein n=1 Tax=Parthenolecanium corni TaxID=536013 RepID=A0AAN9Y5M8_9HEMI